MPCPASCLTLFHTSTRDCGSSPVVGSSRKITGGFPMRLMAMSRRRRMPPEYVDTRRPAASVSWKRASRSSAIWPAPFRCRSRATSTRFSRPVRISSTAANCPVRLMDSRTLRRLRGDVEAIHGGRPRVGLEQRGQDFHDRGLACAVGAEQGEDAAPRHVEVHAAQHAQRRCTTSQDPARGSPGPVVRSPVVPSSGSPFTSGVFAITAARRPRPRRRCTQRDSSRFHGGFIRWLGCLALPATSSRG